MITKKLPAAALVLTLGALLAGCPEKGGENADASVAASAAPASAQPAKAFWKKDKDAGTTSNVVSAVPAAAVKPGWAKLPEVEEHLAKEGKKLFDTKGCAACHGFGKKIVGPDLNNITARVEPDWLEKWITNPEPMLASDPYAKEMLAKYLVKMPNQQLKPAQVKAVIEFLRENDHRLAEKGEHKDKDREHS